MELRVDKKLGVRYRVPAPTTKDNYVTTKEAFENPPPENRDNKDSNAFESPLALAAANAS